MPYAPDWLPIETAPKDGTVVLLYWPTMSITAYPAVGFHHGDEYGWELQSNRDYGEVLPTKWMPCPAAPTPEKKIVTSYEYPPIPIRTMDWLAYYEGDEEGGPRGWGRTEAEAVADLRENYGDED